MKGTSASPAVALASSVLPVPGGPVSRAPLGILAPSSVYRSGFLRKFTNSIISTLASSHPATSLSSEKKDEKSSDLFSGKNAMIRRIIKNAMKASINQSINQSMNQAINQSSDQSTNPSINQSISLTRQYNKTPFSWIFLTWIGASFCLSPPILPCSGRLQTIPQSRLPRPVHHPSSCPPSDWSSTRETPPAK